MRQTTIVKHKETQKEWFIIDAKDQILGRVSTLAANYLRGKHKPTYTDNVDMGDNIIIINAKDIVLTANKEEDKIYYRHTGYPGGLRKTTPAELRKRRPCVILEKAIKGMLPHNKLGAKQYRNLKVYEGSEHEQQAQKPKVLEVK